MSESPAESKNLPLYLAISDEFFKAVWVIGLLQRGTPSRTL
jgi:hypothetical protein